MNDQSLQLQTDHESHAIELIERAQIDMQISTAKKYPRTLSKVKADMLSFATLDEETASGCFYTLPRGGKTIQGPSVRLAEIAVSCYGNLRAGARVIQTETTGPSPHVIVQAVAHDLEKNTAITIEKRRRITKKKSKDSIDEDDINLACNACSSIAFRDAVFKIVPLALVKPIFEAAKKVAVGDVKSLSRKRGQVIDRLKQMGVTEDRILLVVECRKVEDIGLEQLEKLIGIGTALKDGELTIEEAFPKDKPKATFGGQDKPQDKPATETPADAPMTPQAKLAAFLSAMRVSFDDLRKWMAEKGIDADSIASVDELNDNWCSDQLSAFYAKGEKSPLGEFVKKYGVGQ